MKWLGIALLLAAAAPAQTLDVMTFNVRFPNPDDGANIWENRRDLLVETIRNHDPVLFGTQELYFSQGRYIAENLPDYDWFGVSRRGNHEDEHMGVFYKRGELFVIESGNFWLSKTPEEPGSMSWNISLPRMVTWARFRHAEGEEFYYLNTHFPHRREDELARVECAKVIARWIEDHVPAGAALIVAGDFNSAADSEVHDILTAELEDAWEAAEKRSELETTSSGWTGAREGRRIDWVLLRGGWTVAEATVVDDNRDGRYPSDHYPVFVRLSR